MRNDHYRGSRDWNDNRPGQYNRDNYERRQWEYYNRGRDDDRYYQDRNHQYDEFIDHNANRDDGRWNDTNSYYDYRDERNMGDFVERTGEKLKEVWNRWTHRDEHPHYERDARGYYDHDRRNDRNYHRDYNDEPGFFERAGEAIREKWDNWTHRNRHHHDDDVYRNDSYRYEPDQHHRYRLRLDHFPYDRNEKTYGSNNWERNANRGRGRSHGRWNRQRRNEFSW
jgi:hypothetical protein